jgi:hypothetical protein
MDKTQKLWPYWSNYKTGLDWLDCHEAPNSRVDHLLLTALPFKNVLHIELSPCSLSCGVNSAIDVLAALGSMPAFNNLVSLKARDCDLHTLDPLLTGTNTFPHLTTLDISRNRGIDITALARTPKLASLKELNLTDTQVIALNS